MNYPVALIDTQVEEVVAIVWSARELCEATDRNYYQGATFASRTATDDDMAAMGISNDPADVE